VSPQPQTAVGTPVPRVDGRLKVTGKAQYAVDHDIDAAVHAVVVDSSIGRGRVTGIDTRAAEGLPGVLKVISHRNAPTLPYLPNTLPVTPPGERLRIFQDDRVRFHGQPIAVVVATTLETAQHGASLVEVTYDAEQPSTDLAHAPAGEPQTYARGDTEKALSSAAVRMDMTHRLARNNHNAMEPHATIARWDGDKPHRLGQIPVGVRHTDGTRHGVRYGAGVGARDLAIRRRRVRQRTASLATCHHRGTRRPRNRTPRQARPDS